MYMCSHPWLDRIWKNESSLTYEYFWKIPDLLQDDCTYIHVDKLLQSPNPAPSARGIIPKCPFFVLVTYYCRTYCIQNHSWDQSNFQEPKLEVLYHTEPYFWGTPPYIDPSNLGSWNDCWLKPHFHSFPFFGGLVNCYKQTEIIILSYTNIFSVSQIPPLLVNRLNPTFCCWNPVFVVSIQLFVD